jgi:hypothetical protein
MAVLVVKPGPAPSQLLQYAQARPQGMFDLSHKAAFLRTLGILM